MVSCVGSVKATIVINEGVWNEFKRMVSSRYGFKKFSFALEEVIKCFNAAELLSTFSKFMGITISVYPSVKDVENRRPKLKTSAGKIIREMRHERETRVYGFK